VPTTKRQVVFASIALVSLTLAVYVANARTATVPQAAAPGMAALPIGIVELVKSATHLPEHQYDAF
jgi:hypothetical protein